MNAPRVGDKITLVGQSTYDYSETKITGTLTRAWPYGSMSAEPIELDHRNTVLARWSLTSWSPAP